MIIGICGDIGAGKDFTADHLVQEYGFTKFSFADELKEWMFSLVGPLGVERRHLFGTQADKNEPLECLIPRSEAMGNLFGPGLRHPVKVGPHSPEFWCGRTLLEFFGTDIVRQMIHPDAWVRMLRVRMEDCLHGVIPDARFPNEHLAIRGGDMGQSGLMFRAKIDATHQVFDVSTDADGVEIPVMCPAGLDWRDSCRCGKIESTGHASDEVWRHLPFDHLVHAAKPGLADLVDCLDGIMGELDVQ